MSRSRIDPLYIVTPLQAYIVKFVYIEKLSKAYILSNFNKHLSQIDK